MTFFNKRWFVSIFLLVFSGTLLVLWTVQAIFWTIRWYNQSEQTHETLQRYPVYSAWEQPTQTGGVIRVFIAPKPTTTESNVYVFLQNTASERQAALSTVTPEKAQNINQKIQEVITVNTTPIVPEQTVERFQTPVQILTAPESSGMPQGYSKTIDTVLTGTYFRDVLWSFPLIVDINRTSPRGQMSNESITLSGRIKSLSEMAKVLVHELAHMVDIYYLRSRGTKVDPSKAFYNISWTEPTVLRSGMTWSSFVSGYAATNQYEDFAETFTMYVFHNTALAERAKNSSVLQQKYDFMRDSVFGSYFIGTNYEQNPVPSSLWDVTKIVIKTNALTDVFAQLQKALKALS